MHIRHLATSFEGTTVAAAEFEHTVHLWNVEAVSHIATFDTILDFGGERLAITADGKQCIASAYHAEGVASYFTQANGEMTWQRKDLKKSQRIKISKDDRRVICCFDEKPCHELDRDTGETIRKSIGIRDCWESPYESLELVVGRKIVLRTADERKLCDIPRETFAVLSVAFGPGVMCISESGGPVRCFSIHSGEEQWRYIPKQGEHFLKLAFVEHANIFAGVCWPYERGGSKSLFHFEAVSGDASMICDIGDCAENAFCLRGSRLLADGRLIDSVTGVVMSILKIPVE